MMYTNSEVQAQLTSVSNPLRSLSSIATTMTSIGTSIGSTTDQESSVSSGSTAELPTKLYINDVVLVNYIHRNLPSNPNLAQQTDNFKIGIIKYIGPIKGYSPNIVDWIGLELVEDINEGHNGNINGIQYFQCRKKCGIHIRVCDVIHRINPYEITMKLQQTISIFKSRLNEYVSALRERDDYIEKLKQTLKDYKQKIRDLSCYKKSDQNSPISITTPITPITPILITPSVQQQSPHHRVQIRRHYSVNSAPITVKAPDIKSILVHVPENIHHANAYDHNQLTSPNNHKRAWSSSDRNSLSVSHSNGILDGGITISRNSSASASDDGAVISISRSASYDITDYPSYDEKDSGSRDDEYYVNHMDKYRMKKNDPDRPRYNPIIKRRAQRNIYIPPEIIANYLPQITKENIFDIYGYLDKMAAIQIKLEQFNNLPEGFCMAINYGLHDHKDNELYFIMRRKNRDPFKWEMTGNYCEAPYIKDINGVTARQPVRLDILYKKEFKMIEKIQDETVKYVLQTTDWCSKRMCIFNKKIKRGIKRTLTIREDTFIKHVMDCVHNINNNYIPMIMFDGKGEYWIEFLFIVRIDRKVVTDVGIALRFDIELSQFVVSGIHLNKTCITNQHMLILPYTYHHCHCLDNFISNIDELKIIKSMKHNRPGLNIATKSYNIDVQPPSAKAQLMLSPHSTY